MERLNSLEVERFFREKGICIFTPLDFQRFFDVSFSASKNFINRHISSGLFIKVKNGLYVFAERKPSKFVLANKIYLPSYISFETALSYHHIIPESIYTIFSATARASRKFEAIETKYVYHHMRKKLFFGYVPKKINGMTFLIAEPQKALLDYLYFVDLKKKTLCERLDLTNVKRGRLIESAKIFQRKGLINLIDKIYVKS